MVRAGTREGQTVGRVAEREERVGQMVGAWATVPKAAGMEVGMVECWGARTEGWTVAVRGGILAAARVAETVVGTVENPVVATAGWRAAVKAAAWKAG